MIRLLLTFILTFILVGVILFVFTQTSYIWAINQARRRGIYPRGKITLDHVKDLLRRDEFFLAICAYRSMYRINFRQAKKEVELLERHMNREGIS